MARERHCRDVNGEGIDFSAVNPHVVRKGAAETDGEFVRFESTMYPAADAPNPDLPHERWSLDYEFEHVHPEQAERWEVLSGELRVAVDVEARTLTEGETATLPAGVPHRHDNPTDRPIRVVWERRPAFEDAEWAESLYALAQEGAVDQEGVPGPLQLAVITDAYPDESVYSAAVPVGVQKLAFSALAAVGRLAGYEATHERGE